MVYGFGTARWAGGATNRWEHGESMVPSQMGWYHAPETVGQIGALGGPVTAAGDLVCMVYGFGIARWAVWATNGWVHGESMVPSHFGWYHAPQTVGYIRARGWPVKAAGG